MPISKIPKQSIEPLIQPEVCVAEASERAITNEELEARDSQQLDSMINSLRGKGMRHGASLTPQDNDALIDAAMNGDIYAVRTLIPTCDPRANESAALCEAARHGYLDIVRMLIPVSDPRSAHSKALTVAASKGHLEIVRELLPVSDPGAKGSYALCRAALEGRLEVVRVLIPVSDPRANGSRALRLAAECRRRIVVQELVPVSDAAYMFRRELEEVRLGMDIDADILSVLDELTPHMEESALREAVATLSPAIVKQLPNLHAWNAAQNLREHLPYSTSLTGMTARNRRSL